MRQFFESALFVFLLLVFILIFWGAGLIYRLNYIFWWYDVVAHFLGGAWTALAAFVFLHNSKNAKTLLFVLGIVALVGIAWEFAEFFVDRYIFKSGFTYLSGVYEDTLSD